MKLIDSHCHLDGFLKNDNIDIVLERARFNGIRHFISIGTNLEDCKENTILSKMYNDIDYTVGIHPTYATEVKDVNLDEFFSIEKIPCAIGEIGLDYHFLPNDDSKHGIIDAQKDLFIRQLDFAAKNNLPVVVHSRDAFDDTFDILINSGISGDKILFHCFAYSEKEMLILKEVGVYVSFSGIVTYKSASAVRDALKIADLSKVLLETDCPYLSPVPYRGKENEPAFISATAEFVANFLENKNVLDQIFDNTVRFFSISAK